MQQQRFLELITVATLRQDSKTKTFFLSLGRFVLRRFSPSVGQVGRPLVFIQLLEGNQQLHSDADIESPCSISNMIVNIRSYVNINIVLYLYGHRFFFFFLIVLQ